MFWFRIEQAIGRNSLVGTTFGKPEDIPQHLAANEKHTKLLGNKVYVATAVGNECILGAAIAKNADEASLRDAYQIVKDEARQLNPTLSPKRMGQR